MNETMTTSPLLADPTLRSAAPAARHPRFWRVGTIAGALLGLVLLVAAWAKAIDPLAFAGQIRTEKLDFLFSAETVALIAIALEVGLGLALLLGIRRLWVMVPATLLVVFFVFLTGRTYWLSAHGLLPEAASCGCFGNLVQRSPAEAFWQDLLMLVPPLLMAFLGRDRRGRVFPPVRTAVVAAVTMAALLFAWKAPGLPLDNVATRLHPGVAVHDLCAGAGDQAVCLDGVASGLKQGNHLVVLANLDDPEIAKIVERLNGYAESATSPESRVWLLSSSAPEMHRAFFWQWGPRFEVVEAPEPLLRPLYRRLPRSFRVENGQVVETFSGLPPAPPTPQTATAQARTAS
ncbi:MAG TPA: MauE/DoxX family redox-associated membrane protein [Thermoanaerobaculia bacterium]|nr:MauE/DoxX family redox-associated membrane protein [Thermoanaerobaculia bacterium]